MSKKTKVNINNLWIWGIVIIIIVFGFYLLPRKQEPKVYNKSSTSEITRKYTSKLLKITIDVPVNYSVEEKFGTITLKENVSEREVIITRTGTNYNSLNEYIAASEERNDASKKANKITITINGIRGVVSTTEYANNESLNHKGYSFYLNNWIYSIYTTTQNLYPDLDQIAQSFRYTP